MNNNLNTIKNSSSKKINIMATYVVDAMHSEVNFKVKHLMISTVTGNFAKYDATLVFLLILTALAQETNKEIHT
jgi:hypothetical protein